MSKEYLEDLIIEFDELGFEPTILCDQQKEIESFRNRLKQVLDYLKSLDNANPSEALRKLDDIGYIVLNEIDNLTDKRIWRTYFATIRNYILKAQEQEKVLEIIKEKSLSLFVLKLLKHFDKDEVLELNYQYFVEGYKTITEDFDEDIKEQIATQEEFKLLKRYFEKIFKIGS